MTNFRRLPGLPPYPPYARAFPPEWGSRGREGTVVEFTSGAHSWAGNFAPGLGEHSTALQHPDGRRVLVLARGDIWIVDPDAETAERGLSDVSEMWPVAKPDGFILNLYELAFARLGPTGILWHTRRLSWDGFAEIALTDAKLTGHAWNAIDNRWVPFEVDLSTGASLGGAFDVLGSLTSDWEQLAPNDGAT